MIYMSVGDSEEDWIQMSALEILQYSEGKVIIETIRMGDIIQKGNRFT